MRIYFKYLAVFRRQGDNSNGGFENVPLTKIFDLYSAVFF